MASRSRSPSGDGIRAAVASVGTSAALIARSDGFSYLNRSLIRDGSGGSAGFADNLVEQALVDRAGDGLGRAVGVDDDQRRLVRNAESIEHVTGVVADLRERQAVLVDESLEGVVTAGPRDADEVGGILKPLGCLLDRGGFTVADASSGCPEPEHRRLVGHERSVEFATADQRGRELQGGRHHDGRFGGRRGFLRSRSWPGGVRCGGVRCGGARCGRVRCGGVRARRLGLGSRLDGLEVRRGRGRFGARCVVAPRRGAGRDDEAECGSADRQTSKGKQTGHGAHDSEGFDVPELDPGRFRKRSS